MDRFIRASSALALIAALVVGGGAAASSRRTHRFGAHHHAHKIHMAKVKPIHFIKMAGERGSRRTGEFALGGPAAKPLRLSLDQPWGGRGRSSLGYQRLSASPLDAHEVNAAAGAQFGAPTAVVGGGVSYRF